MCKVHDSGSESACHESEAWLELDNDEESIHVDQNADDVHFFIKIHRRSDVTKISEGRFANVKISVCI